MACDPRVCRRQGHRDSVPRLPFGRQPLHCPVAPDEGAEPFKLYFWRPRHSFGLIEPRFHSVYRVAAWSPNILAYDWYPLWAEILPINVSFHDARAQVGALSLMCF